MSVGAWACVADNEIGPAGAASLSAVLEKNTTLTTLNLRCAPHAHRAGAATRATQATATPPLSCARAMGSTFHRSAPEPLLLLRSSHPQIALACECGRVGVCGR